MTSRARPPSDRHRSREVLTSADATAFLVDMQLDRLQRLLTEVRNSERFIERRGADTGHEPERRAS